MNYILKPQNQGVGLLLQIHKNVEAGSVNKNFVVYPKTKIDWRLTKKLLKVIREKARSICGLLFQTLWIVWKIVANFYVANIDSQILSVSYDCKN